MNFHKWLDTPRRIPLVMGILNVTPDSFSDGGLWTTPPAAADRARQMLAEGAALIDVGGESTRPGSLPVSEQEQIARVVPVIREIVNAGPAIISIDTTRAAVAEAALNAGATLVNDISAGRDDPALLPLVARRGVPVVLMHMQGTPATMQLNPTYSDVTADVQHFLVQRIQAAELAGVEANRIILDPGIGFGKTVEQNLQLLRDLAVLQALGHPLLVGTSRKGFIGHITGETDPQQRVFGTAATTAWAIANGVAILRVHDVEPMTKVVKMIRAIMTGTAPSS